MKLLKLKIACILLAAGASIIGSWMQQAANAQINNNINTSTNQNILGQNIPGSFPIALNQTIVSQIKTGMSNATVIAEKTIGPNSHAVLAVLETEQGSLVFTIWTADSGLNLHRVQIDPTNGKILSSQPLTMAMRQQAMLEIQRGMMAPIQGGIMAPVQTGTGPIAPSQASPGQGGMISPGQTGTGQASPGQGVPGQPVPGQGGMMSPGQASPGQSGMNGKP